MPSCKVKIGCLNCSYQGPSAEVGCGVNGSQVPVSCAARVPCDASMHRQSLSCPGVLPQLAFAAHGCLSHCVSRAGLLTHLVRTLRPLWGYWRGGPGLHPLQIWGLPQWGWAFLPSYLSPRALTSYRLLKGGCNEKKSCYGQQILLLILW